jgi:hypothetical protein
MSKQYVIEDWAGNRLFPDKTFPTFEDGWDFLLKKFPDEDLQDYYVV